jgi:hypothetical protein
MMSLGMVLPQGDTTQSSIHKATGMSRVPRELIEHELHLDPKAKPVKQ